jgi:hypothetical protein
LGHKLDAIFVRGVEKPEKINNVFFQHESLGAAHILVCDGGVENSEEWEGERVSFYIKVITRERRVREKGKKL